MGNERWQVGQRLVVGFPGTTIPQALRDLVHTYKIGNIILFEENIENKEQLHTLCDDLQALIQGETGKPALISIDQEGGVVSRLRGDCAIVPSAMAISASGKPENAYLAGKLTGEELSALGVNMDLAPVMDVNSNPQNPVIGARSYGADPETVCAFGTEMIRGLGEGGVLSCAKHFPGHGDTAVDSHLGLPRVDKSLEALEACELKPFRAAIEAGVSAVMTTHILFPQLEPSGVPATMSRRIMTDLLRQRMGFSGLIVSDCMMMGAIQQSYGTVPGCVAACKAGVDLVFISHSMPLAAQASDALVEALEQGALSREEMNDSLERILAWKERLAELPSGTFEAVGGAEHRRIANALREAGATQVGQAPLPPLGENPLFLGCYPFRPTLVSSPVDTRVAFPTWMQQELGGEARITSIDPEEEEIAQAVEQAKGHSCLVLGTYNGHVKRGQVRLLHALAALGLPMICVALRNPYDLTALPPQVYGLALYEYSLDSLALARRILTGEAIPQGRLPVTLEERS